MTYIRGMLRLVADRAISSEQGEGGVLGGGGGGGMTVRRVSQVQTPFRMECNSTSRNRAHQQRDH